MYLTKLTTVSHTAMFLFVGWRESTTNRIRTSNGNRSSWDRAWQENSFCQR